MTLKRLTVIDPKMFDPSTVKLLIIFSKMFSDFLLNTTFALDALNFLRKDTMIKLVLKIAGFKKNINLFLNSINFNFKFS